MKKMIGILSVFLFILSMFSPSFARESITVCASGCNYTSVYNAITGMWAGDFTQDSSLCVVDDEGVMDEFYTDCYAHDYNCSLAQTEAEYLCDQQDIDGIYFWAEDEDGGFAPKDDVNFTTDYYWNYNDAFEVEYRKFTFNTSVMPVVQQEEADSGGYIYFYNTGFTDTSFIVYKNWEVCNTTDCGGRGASSTEIWFDTNGFDADAVNVYAVGEAYVVGDGYCDTENWEDIIDYEPDCQTTTETLTGMAVSGVEIILPVGVVVLFAVIFASMFLSGMIDAQIFALLFAIVTLIIISGMLLVVW